MVPNEKLHILTIHFELPKRGQPLYKGQDVWSQGVLYMEVPLFTIIGSYHTHNTIHVTCAYNLVSMTTIYM